MSNKENNNFFKQYWKYIVSFGVIFLILVGGYLLITLFDPTKKSVEEVPVPTISLLNVDAALVQQIEVSNTSEELVFIKTENGWMLKDFVDIELLQDRVDTLVYSAATLSATRSIVTNATDMTSYGLNSPQATVSLQSQNGSAAVFHIGNMTPAGDGYYVCLDGKNDVYMIATGTASQFLSDKNAFRKMNITEMHHTQIRRVSIKNEGVLIELSYVAPPEGAYPGSVSTWQMTSPLFRSASNDVMLNQVLQPISNISAVSVAEDNPADLSIYGFDGDYVTVSTDAETVHFDLGMKDGVYFARLEGDSAVYVIGPNLPFLHLTAFELVEKETALISLDTVDKVELNLPGMKATLRVETEGDALRLFVNDKQADEKKFKYFYMELSGLSIDGMATTTSVPQGANPSASIVYTLKDGSTTTLLYYPYDDFNYALYENGECTFYVKRTRLTNLAASLRALDENPTA